MSDEHRRMHFLYQEKPTMLQKGDRAVMDFDKKTMEFIRNGATLGIQPRNGRPASSLEVGESMLDVVILLLDLCTGLSAATSVQETKVTLTFSKRTSLKQGTYSLVWHNHRTSLKAGDRVSADSLDRSIAFSRNETTLLIRNDKERGERTVYGLTPDIHIRVIAATVQQCLELFTNFRAKRLSPSGDGEIFELDP